MTLEIRPREAADVPRLVEVLTDQRAASGYPFRWPLPFPAEEFVVRTGEERAWVAELDGVVVGEVAVHAVVDDEFGRIWADAVAAPVAGLAAVGPFFVDPAGRGRGVGRALMARAVAWIRGEGRVPVLDVLPSHGGAVRLYETGGWREIGRGRPPWLPPGEPPVILMVLDPPAAG